ncbi:MAG TPA: phage tail protein [Acidimicrobiales bacterium]|nr:phage tail protein [Acidimicrobiales bacterium]
MRGVVEGLASPHPIGLTLPALYQEDEFALRLTAAFDEVWAPVFAVLDNLTAYLDPSLAPLDFVEYLARWVGVELDETWPEERRRDLVGQAVELYRWRGTVHGLAALVAVYTGVEPEIEESGGAAWSPTPGGELPGSAEPSLTVRVRVADPSTVDAARLEAIVAAAKPAHIPHQVEVLPA